MRRFLFLLPLAAFASAAGEVRSYWSAVAPETDVFRTEWREEKGWRSIFVCDAGGLTPDFFRRIVAESGGYAPAPVGVQVNMSGNFISLHAARNARFDFPLPFDCAVTDLRSGRPVPTDGRVLPLELKVGDSRWFGLKEVRCDD